MRLAHRVSMAAALLAGSFIAIVSAPAISAQDATPAASPCAATTPQQNVQLVTDYIHVTDSANAAAIDAALADTYADNQDRYGLPVDPTTNADEANLAAMLESLYPGSVYTINQVSAVGDNQVVADITLTITAFAPDPSVDPTVLATPIEFNSLMLATVDCGEIVSARGVSDQLGLLLALGFTVVPPAMATPTS